MRFAYWLFLIPTLATPALLADPIQLPDMGASSSTVLSPQKEAEVGAQVTLELRRAGDIVDDPFVEDYLERLGYRLLAVTDTGTRFTFFTLNDSTINAFALPGGYVGVNAGLVIASRNESELAGVVAHEIAHVTQSHIARSLEESSRSQLPMTAAIIAALVLGQQDPQVGQAAIATAIASSTQTRLDFSRTFEQEADRVGIGMLAQAGFDPDGMPSFFERLYQETRFSGGEAAQLEFLRTHPVTVSRIADSRNRAAQYERQVLQTPTTDYEFAKVILQVRIARDPAAAVSYFQNALAQGHYPNTPAAHLGLALAQLNAGHHGEARAALERAQGKSEPGPLLMRVRAMIERAAGNTAKAETLLRRATALYPEDRGAVFAYARLMLDKKRYGDAAALVSAHLRHHDAPQAYALLAEAETGRGRAAAAHLALAEEAYRLGDTPLALEQLRVARNDPKADFYTLSRVEARLSELERLMPDFKPDAQK